MANKILNVTNHLNKGFINTAGNSGSCNYLSWRLAMLADNKVAN